jgi:type II secretory ATPase GspE/PulE/Tfp pilus assembly ATPase PilB-like protein
MLATLPASARVGTISVKAAFGDLPAADLRLLATSHAEATFAASASAMLEPGCDLGDTLAGLSAEGIMPMPVRHLGLPADLAAAFEKLIDLQATALFPRSLAQLEETPVPAWPWIPVGTVGPLVILGHCAPTSVDTWTIDPDLCPRAWIPPAAYLAQLERVLALPWVARPASSRSAHRPPERLAAIRRRLTDTPEDARPAELIRWLLTALPVRPSEREALETCLRDDVLVLPTGFSAALDWLEHRHPVLDVRPLSPDAECHARLPKSLAEKHHVLCVCETARQFFALVGEGYDDEVEDQIINRLRLDKPIVWIRGRTADIGQLLDRNTRTTAGVISDRRAPEAATTLVRGDVNLREDTLEQINPKNIHTPPESLLHWILHKAIVAQASDLHFEQFSEATRVRARVDGSLVTLYTGPLDALGPMVAIVKNHAGLTMNPHDAQDGRFSVRFGRRLVDVRVSAIPWRRRLQKLTLRLLDKTASLRTLDQLGLSPGHLATLQDVLRLPQGLCLVTGPTGSGKTTMLYAALLAASDPTVNVQTIEDPIEYELEGINQTQVDERHGLAFSTLLRRLLRADPDIIMVGEVRDKETAVTAAESALTGHLVLTTLHALDSIRAVGRLAAMGVAPYMLADSLVMLHAQRLSRRLCACRHERPATEAQRQVLGQAGLVPPGGEPPLLFEPAGCPDCGGTGYRGRTAVIELYAVSDAFRDLVLRNASAEQLGSLAAAEGFESMHHHALRKALAGELTFQEAALYRRL